MQQALNEEALHLLKEQVSKLKLLSNELELRDKQVDMLKDTIRSIEDQRDDLIGQNDQLRLDLSTLTDDVQKKYTRFETSVAALEDQRRSLLDEQQQLKVALTNAHKQAKSASKLSKQLQLQKEDLHRQLKTLREQLRQYSSSNNGTLAELQAAKRQLKQQKELIEDQQAELAQSKQNSQHSQQQLQLFKTKYEQIARTSQAHLRDLQTEKARTKQLQQLQKQLEHSRDEITKLRGESDKYTNTLQRRDRQNFLLKDSLLDLKAEHEKLTSSVEVDFKCLFGAAENLKEVDPERHYRKSGQFYSKYASSFENMEQLLVQLHQRSRSQQEKIASFHQDNGRLRHQLDQKQTLLLDLSGELDMLRLSCQNEIKAAEVEYELRLQQLAVKLKREEVELQRLRNSDRDLNLIQEQLEKVKIDFQQESERRRSQNEQLMRQNTLLQDQLNGMIPLCEQAIRVKNLNNHMKSVICQLVRHVLFAASRMREQGVFLGMLKGFYHYYDRVHTAIRKKQPSKRRLGGLASFRASVFVVVVVNRLARQQKHINQHNPSYQTYSHNLKSTVGKDKGVRKLLRQSCLSQQGMINNSDVQLVGGLLSSEEPAATAQLLIMTLSERLSWAARRYRPFNIGRTSVQDISFLDNVLQKTKIR